MKRVVLWVIRFYQRYISSTIAQLGFVGTDCTYRPTCSQFTYEAVNRYGIIVGLWMGGKRILRCHPWSRGGFDPVP